MRPLLVVAMAVTLAACSTPGSQSTATPTLTDSIAPTTMTPGPTPTSDPSPDVPGTPATSDPREGAPLDGVSATWEVVGSGFAGPVQVLVDPRDDTLLVAEQVGRIGPVADPGGLLDLTDRVTSGGERGLLGVAFHPDRDRLYVHYSGRDGQTVLSVFPVGDDAAFDPGAEDVLFTVEQPAANHNGGALLFDPSGALVLALGDGGGAGDRFGNGQDPATPLATLLRFDVDRTPGQLAPHPDNPFLDGGGDPNVWAYGLRNPWRIAFDDERLYVADVGQDAVEEVSVVGRDQVAGANFGWPILEGSRCYQDPDCDPTGLVVPVAELTHADGACSIIGGVVVPAGPLAGAYLYSDLCDTALRALRVRGGDTEVAAIAGADLPGSPLGFGLDADGQVHVGTADGQVLRLVVE